MKSNLILVFTSPDRPGVIEKLTTAVVGQGGNWEESRLARLCGDFAGIVRLTIEAEAVEGLEQRLQQLSSEGIAVHVKPAVEPPASPDASTAQLSCAGADHEGIVHRLAAYLAGQGINIEEMETKVEPAPISGTPVFRMESLLALPPGTDIAALQAKLRELADELAVDLTWDGEAV